VFLVIRNRLSRPVVPRRVFLAKLDVPERSRDVHAGGVNHVAVLLGFQFDAPPDLKAVVKLAANFEKDFPDLKDVGIVAVRFPSTFLAMIGIDDALPLVEETTEFQVDRLRFGLGRTRARQKPDSHQTRGSVKIFFHLGPRKGLREYLLSLGNKDARHF